MKDVVVRKGVLKPSEGKHENISEQFIWRKTGNFVGKNQIVIMDTQEPIWWNRPLESDIMVKQEDDGLYSYNLPFLGNRDVYKTGYNLLLGKNSITYTGHILLDDSWTEEQKDKLLRLSYDALYESLLELGVDETKLQRTRNDMLYNGKKFAGGEQVISGSVYTEDMVITMQFLPEKDIFSRLTGKYANVRGITGIEEEVSNVTKEKLIEKMYNKITQFFAELD